MRCPEGPSFSWQPARQLAGEAVNLANFEQLLRCEWRENGG
jgi:hypothetical protein